MKFLRFLHRQKMCYRVVAHRFETVNGRRIWAGSTTSYEATEFWAEWVRRRVAAAGYSDCTITKVPVTPDIHVNGR